MLLLLAALAVPLQAVEFSTAAPFNLPGLSRPAAARPVPAAAPAEAAPSASRAKWGRDALTYLKANSLSPDPEVRAAVAAAWGEIGNPRTLPLLRRAAKDRNDFVRVEAAVSLHKLGDEQGREVLLAVARSSAAPKGKLTPASEMKALSRTKARALALIKLSDLGGEDAVALMEQTLFDRSGAVRDATAVALCRLGLEEQFPRQFLGAAKDKDESVRAEAIKALGQTNLASVRATLVGAANDPAAAVRAEAVAALAAAKDESLAPVFIERLKDESPRVRYQAAGGLAAIAADSAAAPVLRRLAADEKAPDLALKAMSGLAARGENVNIDLAERQLRSADIDGRLLAVEVLSRAASAQALELLAKVTTEDNSPRVRVAAATELVKRLQRKGSAR